MAYCMNLNPLRTGRCHPCGLPLFHRQRRVGSPLLSSGAAEVLLARLPQGYRNTALIGAISDDHRTTQGQFL
jgi:hypothetical protein